MKKKVETLEKMECWDVIEVSKIKRNIHTKIVLKRTRHEKFSMVRYKARLVTCVSGEYEFQAEGFSPVANLAEFKLMFCLALRKVWIAKHLEFENPFLNEILESPVYAELASYMFSEEKRKTKVLRLKRSFYVLKHAACIWNKCFPRIGK